MKDVSNKIHSASSTLVHSGYAVMRIDGDLLDVVDDVFRSADEFFARPIPEKRRFAKPEVLEGYRTFGAEFSESPDRPDLNETFSLAPRNMTRDDLAGWPAENPLHKALRAAARPYAALVDAVLDDLRLSFDIEGDRIASAEFSYFQINYYRPRNEKRDLLQDGHEDGHLLTVVTSRQPGLEIEVDGRFEPMSLAPNELLLMPGGILTLMTGGRIKPLVHRVRNATGLSTRASLMFFVNASVTRPPRAWAPAEDGSWPDIGRATIESSKVFGLQSIEALAQ